MKAELDRSKASFKLDLIETANADPMVGPADLKVLAAYMAVMAWPSCRAWLAASLAQAMTGLSERQFRTSRGRLLGKNAEGRAYLTAARQSGTVAAYVLINPWRSEAQAHVIAMLGYHREVERKRKEEKRAVLSLQNLPGHIGGCPCKICRSVPAEFAAYTPLLITPTRKIFRSQTDSGPIVEHINQNRKRAS